MRSQPSGQSRALRAILSANTADLLKISPGIWPESSGVQTGANIEVAGFPTGGDAPFFTNMIEGSPLYGIPSLSCMDLSSLLRLADPVEAVEVVQGGAGPVFGPGQPGATAKFMAHGGTVRVVVCARKQFTGTDVPVLLLISLQP